MGELTQTLAQMDKGDPVAAEQLLPLVYEELRKLAAARMARESPDHTLEATALVHEAYVRLVEGAGPGWNGRGHFFAAAAEAMRRILIERARRKNGPRQGGNLQRVELIDLAGSHSAAPLDLLELDEALTRLEHTHPAQAELVKLRFFAGLSLEEAASAQGISTATAKRNWTYARAWLYGQLGEPEKDREKSRNS